MEPVTHASVVLERDTDVVEFCPHDGMTHLLAVGTYTLNEDGVRDGSIHLFDTTSDEPSEAPQLREHRCVDNRDAVFDLKWAPATHAANAGTGCLLAHAGTSGTLFLYRVTPDAMECIHEVECSQQAGLCTSVDWSPPCTPGALLATATSACEVVVVDAQAPGGARPLVYLPNAHDLETWMVAFDRFTPSLLFSGADDAAFKAWDLRVAGAGADSDTDGVESAAVLTMAGVDRRTHQAGVCCIMPSPWEEHVVLTGSYDEKVRLWDTRNLRRCVETAELEMGGGVWRLKWHPQQSGVVAAACMYNGFFTLEGACAGGPLALTGEYAAHDNSKIAYGVDWSHGAAQGAEPLLATCSFYERRVNLWSPK